MRAIALAALIVLSSALAFGQGEPAAPSFEVIDRGDAVEVVAHNVKAARTAILPLRQRLQVPIAGTPAPRRITPTDPTVKLVEFDSEDTTRVLSVKLSFERNDVRTLSRYAQAIQVGDDLHVIVPRKLPTDGAAPKLPEPTLPPAAAAAVAKADAKPPIGLGPTAPPPAPPAKPSVIPSIAPQLGPVAPVPAPAPAKPAEAKPPEPTKPAEATVGPVAPVGPVGPLKVEVKEPEPVKAPAKAPTQEPVKEPAKAADEPHEKVFGPQPDPLAHLNKPAEKKAEPAAGTTKPKPDALSQTLAPASETSWASAIVYVLLGAAALGAGVWQVRRKRNPIAPMASIEILAQRSLGGRARLVWLTAGPHEILVAVTAQQINLLGQWPRDGAAHVPAHATFAETMAASMPAAAAATAEPAPGRFGFGPASAYAKHKATSQPLPPLPPLRAKRPSMAREAALDVDVELEPAKPAKQMSRPLPVAKQAAGLVAEESRPSRPAIVLPPTPAAEPVRPRRPSVRAKTTIEAPAPRPPPAVISDDRDGELDAMLAAVSGKPEAKPAEAAHSPAVDGILRLRQNSKPAIIDAESEEHNGGPLDDDQNDDDHDEDDEVAPAPPPPVARRVLTEEEEHAGGPLDEDDGNADPEANQAWIKDILAATGGNR